MYNLSIVKSRIRTGGDFASSVLWSRSRKEPKLLAGELVYEVLAPTPGQTKVVYKNLNSY